MLKYNNCNKKERELFNELDTLKDQKILNFIYDSFANSEFKDKRIISHIIYKTEANYDFLNEVEILMFVKEFPKEKKKYDNEDYLVMFRDFNTNYWNIVNFHGAELVRKLSDKMLYYLLYSIPKEIIA